MKYEFTEELLTASHKHSFLNKKELIVSNKCGCFHCLAIFNPNEIQHWHYETNFNGFTAFCPFCSVDCVIGSASNFPITSNFLATMQRRWCI